MSEPKTFPDGAMDFSDPRSAAPAGTPGASDADPVPAGSVEINLLAQWMQDAGHFTPGQRAEALRAEGIEAPAAPSEVDQHLTEIGFTPAKPEEFELPKVIGENEQWTP